jgi:hypothetical protein
MFVLLHWLLKNGLQQLYMSCFWFAFQNFCKDCLQSNFLATSLDYAEGTSPIARCMLSSTADAARWADTQLSHHAHSICNLQFARPEAHHRCVRSNLSCWRHLIRLGTQRLNGTLSHPTWTGELQTLQSLWWEHLQKLSIHASRSEQDRTHGEWLSGIPLAAFCHNGLNLQPSTLQSGCNSTYTIQLSEYKMG